MGVRAGWVFTAVTGRLQAQPGLRLAAESGASAEGPTVRVFMTSVWCQAWTPSLKGWAAAEKGRAGPKMGMGDGALWPAS